MINKVISRTARKTEGSKWDLTLEIEIIHRSNVRLGLSADISNTFGFTTITRLCFVTASRKTEVCESNWDTNIIKRHRNAPITIDVVIESKFLIFLHLTTGEDTHAIVVSDGPFGYITIRRTAVVQKPADTSSFGCIDVLYHCKRSQSVGIMGLSR
jgi:hypothetical protein